MNLLVDMGNTRLKWAIQQDGQVIPGPALLNAGLDQQQLLNLWQELPTPERLAIACVSTHHLAELVHGVAKQLWPGVEILDVKAQAQACGVVNAYAHPETLGIDRWLALIATHHNHPTPACIVDCGTAITIDFIDDTGFHLGGLISPGLQLMKNALAKGTGKLTLSQNHYSFGIANQTDAAIYSGTLASAAGLIEYVLQQHPHYHLVLTGGDAELIANHLTTTAHIDADLVLHGLALILLGQS